MSSYDKVIVIESLTSCNLSCPFCAHDSRLQIKRSAIEVSKLRNFLEIVGKWSLSRKKSALVSWLGGEPFLYQGLKQLTEEIKRDYLLQFSATTNGTKLRDSSLRSHIAENYTELTVSVDGFAEFHDGIRGREGLFQEIKDCIQLLTSEAPQLKLRINSILMRGNYDSFESLCMELAEWKIDEITFNQLGGRDRPEFYPDNRLTERQADELPELINKIRSNLSKTRTKLISSEGYLRRIQASAHDRLLPIMDCQAGSYYLFVNAKGKVAPCSFTIEEYGKDISSILNAEDFESLPYTFQTGKLNSQALACKDCPCTNVHGKFS